MNFQKLIGRIRARFAKRRQLVLLGLYAKQGAAALISSRVLALLGFLVLLAVGLGTADWLAAMSGMVIMVLALMLHGYRQMNSID